MDCGTGIQYQEVGDRGEYWPPSDSEADRSTLISLVKMFQGVVGPASFGQQTVISESSMMEGRTKTTSIV